jgi:RNA polymerase sigma-70 factor (ECF subfamily)
LSLAWVLKSWRRDGDDPNAALLQEARSGNQRAFDALRRLHELPLRGFVARRVGSDAAEDLTQEIWLACWQALPRYQGRSRFKAWLYGIATHKCADCLRARSQEIRRQEALQQENQTAPDAYRAIDTRAAVQAALSQLPEAQREVLELYYYAELTLAEIAQALDRNLNTVKYQFYRAHTLVAQQLDSEENVTP